MLKRKSVIQKLSLRNARRQLRDYALYFITLLCAVSFLYAFNALLFSESFTALPELDVLPFMVCAATLLVVFILGWTVSYMNGYMLKRRSRELSIYMVSGISSKTVSKMLFSENLILGCAAFFPGLLSGMFLTQLLQAVLTNIYGMPYTLSFFLSLPTAGLTLLCFFAIFLYSLIKTRKWMKKVKLYDLLRYERENERELIKSSKTACLLLGISMFLYMAGIWILNRQPFQGGFSTLWGIILLVLFLLLFFISVPSVLTAHLEKNRSFLYRKKSLLVFRSFNAGIRSMSMNMGILSVLILLSVTAFGFGIAAGRYTRAQIGQYAFDLLILHQDDKGTFPDYDSKIAELTTMQSSHTYNLCTGTGQTFLEVRRHALAQALSDKEYLENPWFTGCREFQEDVSIGQSDYLKLREMLGYEPAALEPDHYYIHCVKALSGDMQELLNQGKTLEIEGERLLPGKVFTEPFSQHSPYGNGSYYLVILPDFAMKNLPVLYSLHAAVTREPVDVAALLSSCGSLALRNVSSAKSSGSGEVSFTMLIDPDADYLSGKWAEKGNLSFIYSLLICLFYLAIILAITGAAILSVQVLGDSEKKKRQDRLLWQLGVKEREITSINRRKFLLTFLFPAVPALAVGSGLILMCAEKIDSEGLSLFSNAGWIWQCIAAAWILFGILYGIYYAAVCGSFTAQSARTADQTSQVLFSKYIR